MSQSELDRLLDQLMSEEVRDRRNAVIRLGELEEPEAIAELVNVYNKDPDPSVRGAAEEALVHFRRLEQEILGMDSDEDNEEESSRPSTNLNPLLLRARMILGVTLAVTLLINLVLFIGNVVPKGVSPTPTVANVLAPRQELITAFQGRITAIRSEATALRQLFSGIQGLGLVGINQEQCQQLALSQVNKVDLAPINAVTYPDLPTVNDLINAPALKVFSVRSSYLFLCGIKDKQQFDSAIKDQGGADKLVARADEVTNKDLPAAEVALKSAIDQPAPTVGPTDTPTPAPTETPLPTATATKAPTAGPKPITTITAAAVNTAIATLATPGEAQKTFTIIDLGLPDLDSYRYRVTGKSNVTLANNKVYNGSMQVTVKRQQTPYMVQIDMNINEGNPALRFFQSIGPLYGKGQSSYVVVDNVLYETGDVLTNSKFNGRCRARRLTGDLNAQLNDYSPNLDGLTFELKESDVKIGGVLANHYYAEQVTGENKDTLQKIDLYLAATNSLPLQLTIVTTLNPKMDAKTRTATGLKDLSVTINYELLDQNIAVDALKPIICEGVPIR